MKRTFTQPPVIPDGYTGKDYNKWVKHIYRLLYKINNNRVKF